MSDIKWEKDFHKAVESAAENPQATISRLLV